MFNLTDKQKNDLHRMNGSWTSIKKYSFDLANIHYHTQIMIYIT